MARKKDAGHGGGHGWFVTFADLMGLLMSFFVMLTAFSTQDQKKLQLVAGSMRDAFGVQKQSKYAGITEKEGVPTRHHLRNVEQVPPDRASNETSPKMHYRKNDVTSQYAYDRGFALAAATLRQSLGQMPELMNETKMVAIEQKKDGLEIAILDGENRAMFAAGSTEPIDRMRRLLEQLAEPLARLPNTIRIVGHASSETGRQGRLDGWQLSAGRALVVRDILARRGIPHERFDSITGRADTEPLFAEDPSIPANRRVTITLLPAPPPVPPK
jgi:chemotaxis protein MotB